MQKINIVVVKNKETFDHFLSLYKVVQEKKPMKKILQKLEDDFFSAHSPFAIFLAYREKEPIGFMILIDSYSSTLARKTLYLEEFYIKKEWQKHGFGRILFDHLIRYAKKKKIARIEWSTHKHNRLAKIFYKKYPADDQSLFYKLSL